MFSKIAENIARSLWGVINPDIYKWLFLKPREKREKMILLKTLKILIFLVNEALKSARAETMTLSAVFAAPGHESPGYYPSEWYNNDSGYFQNFRSTSLLKKSSVKLLTPMDRV